MPAIVNYGNLFYTGQGVEQSYERAFKLYIKAAEMHAKYWNDRSLFKKKWLKYADWYNGRGQATWSLGIKGSKRYWEKAKSEMNSSLAAVKWSQKLISIIDKSYENSTCNFQCPCL